MSVNGDDTILGTSGNDSLNGGAGSDTIFADAGNDQVGGGAGNDLLDGGAGSDRVSGDAGNDTLIYRASENAGATDIYDGGSGQDKLRLELTLAEWLKPQVQTDIARYLAFLTTVIHPQNGEAKNTEFRFTAFDLRVSRIEQLEIFVNERRLRRPPAGSLRTGRRRRPG